MKKRLIAIITSLAMVISSMQPVLASDINIVDYGFYDCSALTEEVPGVEEAAGYTSADEEYTGSEEAYK